MIESLKFETKFETQENTTQVPVIIQPQAGFEPTTQGLADAFQLACVPILLWVK